ncbi:hypothetical protein CEXT_227171 [Caerostris extrusa]|uniref:Uncharacterized protein n=1 Tax=Caerostris extrusa TaxID=172846 RepID=A0AAV4NDU1_CAEEX|nr:hypothetical protein CEXT_227171 [Caerostris extrusa]
MFLKSCGNSVYKNARSSLPPTPTQGPRTCAPMPGIAGAFSLLYERREVPPFVFMRIGALQEFCMNKCLLRTNKIVTATVAAVDVNYTRLTTGNCGHVHQLYLRRCALCSEEPVGLDGQVD